LPPPFYHYNPVENDNKLKEIENTLEAKGLECGSSESKL
jgi:hypothetical protein